MDELLAGLVFAGFLAAFIAGLMLLVMWISMLFDVCATDADVWALAGHDRAFCFCMVFALGPIGAILYGLAVRPSLARIEMQEAVERVRKPSQWAA